MAISREDVIRRVREEDIHFIRLQFTDIFGQMKNVAVTASQIERAMDNEITIDGSSIEGFLRIQESDMRLFPDPDTFAILPWEAARDREARLICDVHTPDGKPFEGDPRYVLKRMLKKAEAMGFSFNVGPECEFFLFETDERGKPTTTTADDADYFDLAPIDRGEGVRRDVVLALEQMGFEIEASHHEAARGQHEIDFKYADALRTADNIMSFKLAVKTMAVRGGLYATFMPKPVYGINGSGMHTNMSLCRDGGTNAFFDPNGPKQLSKEAHAFIAGLLAHVRGMAAVTNPLVNSYKRLVPGFEAPCYLAWSSVNRSVLIRVPAARGKGTRLELRSPDPSCNPYLAMALCLAAGLDGIERGLTPPAETPENIYAMDAQTRASKGILSLPGSLREALDALKEDELMMRTLGEPLATRYIEGKEREWDEYRTQVTDWEINRYLNVF
ncbi:MAG TPA: type I glutamate--ammonia ligase [Candidatus Limnocylindria bacterium]|nr:type I glutamate--ammonia ligase [Candidatus Limnocylindria bacterium]